MLISSFQEEGVSMKLYYSPTSPYSRKVRLLAMHHALDVEIVMTNPLENGAAFLAINPLAKVPALVMDGRAIFDSPVIAEYILKLAGADRSSDAYLKQLELQALLDGVTDSAVATVMEGRREDAEQSAMWLARWDSSIDRGLALLETEIEDLTDWNLASMATACALDYLCFRLPHIVWQAKYPKCAAWYSEAVKRADMIETDPRG